jgi:hypothetical protein
LRNSTARILARRAVTAVRYRRTERGEQGDMGKKMRHGWRRMAEQALLLMLLDCGSDMHNAQQAMLPHDATWHSTFEMVVCGSPGRGASIVECQITVDADLWRQTGAHAYYRTCAAERGPLFQRRECDVLLALLPLCSNAPSNAATGAPENRYGTVPCGRSCLAIPVLT